MAKKSTKKDNPQYHKEENYYELKTDAIEKLVTASEETVEEVGAEELNKYKSSPLDRLPVWIKVLFAKFWFNGAVCFFFFWGLGIYVSNQMDLFIIVAIAMGVITDLLLNNLLRFMDDGTKTTDKWMMFPKKKFWTFFANVAYSFVIMTCVALTYNGINLLFGAEQTGEITVGVEPLLFGLLCMLFDIGFVMCKNLLVTIINDAKNKNSDNESK